MAIRDASGKIVTDQKIINKFNGKMQPTGFSVNPSGSTVSGKFVTPQDLQKQSLEIQNLQKNLDKKDTTSGIPPAQMGYLVATEASMKEYDDLMNDLKKGNITYNDIRQAFLKTPTDKTAKINTTLFNGTDAWLRIQTGAQANPSEIYREMAKFQPKPWDSDKTVDFKLKALFKDRLDKYAKTLRTKEGNSSTPATKQETKPKDDPLGVL